MRRERNYEHTSPVDSHHRLETKRNTVLMSVLRLTTRLKYPITEWRGSWTRFLMLIWNVSWLAKPSWDAQKKNWYTLGNSFCWRSVPAPDLCSTIETASLDEMPTGLSIQSAPCLVKCMELKTLHIFSFICRPRSRIESRWIFFNVEPVNIPTHRSMYYDQRLVVASVAIKCAQKCASLIICASWRSESAVRDSIDLKVFPFESCPENAGAPKKAKTRTGSAR